jgi:hypothetical protein
LKYPDDMDQECVKLCDALNALSGIETSSSCCGHSQRPFRIFFSAETIESLAPILRACHSSAWRTEVAWANGSDNPYFMLEGPKGLSAQPGGADDFAGWLEN